MAVSAQWDKKLSFSANDDAVVDMRTGGRPSAGSYLHEGGRLVTTWHAHDLHQVEYSFHGAVEVETAVAHYVLPPQQAAWIPTGVEHRTTIRGSVRTLSVFFEPRLVTAPGDRVRILAVPPVLKEMMLYSARWPIGRSSSDPSSDAFFTVLGWLVAESLDDEAPLCLPVSSDPVLTRALDWTRENLATATVGQAAHHAGLSERSLRRRCEADLGMSWRDYAVHARLLRAITLLAEAGPSILDVALSVGFESVSSFNRAFRQRTGETPSSYRRQRAHLAPSRRMHGA